MGNMQRDLLHHADQLSGLMGCTCMVDLKLNVKGNNYVDTTATFILPHLLFHKLYYSKQDSFKSWVLGGQPSNIKKFWEEMKDHPMLQHRPALKNRPDLLEKIVPLAVHGDGVQYMQVGRAGGKGLEVLSWCSLLAKGPTKVSNFLMFMVVKSVIKAMGVDKTWGKAWKVLAWSFAALAEGKFPVSEEW